MEVESMTNKNDVTGDRLVSKPVSDAYQENWDRIFNKCKVCGKNLGNGFGVHTCSPQKPKGDAK